MNSRNRINAKSNHLTARFTSSHPTRLYRGAGQPRGRSLQKRVRFELTDEKGIKHIHVVEGPISREDLMKTMDALELMDLTTMDSHSAPTTPNAGTFFGKVQTLLQTSFAAGDFSSSDVAREFEEKFGQPVKLSTISTYLARLADRQYIRREKFGNSWVYRRVYLKPTQVAER